MTSRPLASAEVSGRLALDARDLSALRQQAKDAPDKAVRAAATQFEALFLQTLLKTMRESLPQEGPFASDTTRTYTAMLDQQMSQALAKKGMGIADMLVKQLSGSADKSAGAPAKDAPAKVTDTAAAAASRNLPKATDTAAPEASRSLRPALPAFKVPAARAAANAANAASAGASASATATAFIERMRPHAEAASRATGIPVANLLGQAALETGWGRHLPRAPDGSASHNLFGIKAGARWTGATVAAPTTEFVSGRPVTLVEAFRSYASYADSFGDAARLISGSARYARAVAGAHDPVAYARSLQQAGYATDPRYADKLARAIETVSRLAGQAPAQVAAAAADKQKGAA